MHELDPHWEIIGMDHSSIVMAWVLFLIVVVITAVFFLKRKKTGKGE